MAENADVTELEPRAEEDSRERWREFLEQAKKRLRVCIDSENKNRAIAQEERRFEGGDQWPEDVKNARENDPNGARPCLTINRISAYKRQVINELRQQSPQIKVRAVDSNTDPASASLYSGLIRAIEESCNATDAYMWGADQCVSVGWGYWRVVTEWDGETFEQVIKIKRIRNQYSVYLDPAREETDGSDAKFGFVVRQLPKDEFERNWPDANPGINTDGYSELTNEWYGEETVTVAEYWYIDDESDGMLVLFADGRTARLTHDQYSDLDADPMSGIIEARSISRPVVYQAIVSGSDVLDEPQGQPGRYIPIVEMRGVEEIIDGDIRYSGIIRDLIDPQRQYNYMRSARVERVALEPKAPYIGYKGQFQDPKWKRINSYNHPYLEASWPEGYPRNQTLPLPQRNPGPQMSPGLSDEIAVSAQEFQDVSGLHPASLGEPTADASGAAIAQRRIGSDISQAHYSSAFAMALRHTGRVLIAMIPDVYTGTRAIQIVNGEGEREPRVIGHGMLNGQQGVDITVGRYDVTVDTGPSFATRREETRRMLFQLAGFNPEFARLTADWLVKNSDAEGSEEIAKRFRTMLPQQILESENPELASVANQYQQQIQQMQEALDLQAQQVQQLAMELQNKSQENAIDEQELRRKIAKDFADYVTKMTEIEAKSRPEPLNVPGSVV